MSISQKFKIYFFLILSLVFTLPQIALADKSNKNNKEATSKVKQQLHVQDFTHSSLNVQFRYVNGQLNSIRVLNIASNPVKVSMLESEYVLGPKDYVVVQAPKLKYIKIKEEPYLDTISTVAEKTLPGRFQEEHLYRLPKSETNEPING